MSLTSLPYSNTWITVRLNAVSLSACVVWCSGYNQTDLRGDRPHIDKLISDVITSNTVAMKQGCKYELYSVPNLRFEVSTIFCIENSKLAG